MYLLTCALCSHICRMSKLVGCVSIPKCSVPCVAHLYQAGSVSKLACVLCLTYAIATC